jgi:hypothetical protein
VIPCRITYLEVMPAEIGSKLAVTLETFIAGINSFRIYFSITLHRGGNAFICGAKAVLVDIWECLSTLPYF